MNQHTDAPGATLDYGDRDEELFAAFDALRPDPDDYLRCLLERIDRDEDTGTAAETPTPPVPEGGDVPRPGSLFRLAFRRAATWLPPVLLPASLARAAGVGAAAAAKTKGAKAAAAWVLGLPGLVILLVVALGVIGLRSTRRFEARSLDRLRDRPRRLARARRRELDRHGWIPFTAGVFPFVAAMNFPDLTPSWSMPVVLALGLALLVWRRHRTGCAEREILASDARRVFGTFALTMILLVAFSPGLADPIHALAALVGYVCVGALPKLGGPLRRALDPMASTLFRTVCGIWLISAPHLSADAFGAKWPGLLLAILGVALAVGLRGLGYVLARTARFGIIAGLVQVTLFGVATFLALDGIQAVAEREADDYLSTHLSDIETEFQPTANEWTKAFEAAELLGRFEDERNRIRDISGTRCSALTRYLFGWIDQETAHAEAVTGEESWVNDFTTKLCEPWISDEERLEVLESTSGLPSFEDGIERGVVHPDNLWFVYRLLARIDPDGAADRLRAPLSALLRQEYEPTTEVFALRNRFEAPSYNLSVAILIRRLHDRGVDVTDSIDLHRFRRSLRSWRSDPENRVAARLLHGVGPDEPSSEALWAWWLPAALTLLVSGFAAAVAHRAPAIRSSDADEFV